jgi:hypothetical protein
MIRHLVLAAGLAFASTTAAHAEGCAPEGGEVIAEIEAMNQMVLANDMAGYVAAIKGYIGVDVTASIEQVAQVFTEGFEGCTTIAQRFDTGGMVQNVVVYHGKVGPLFGYWQFYAKDGGFALLTFNLNTDITAIMADLR